MDNINNEGFKVDRRTRKTKKAIKNAFMDLLSKNNINKITVKEISDLADINRKTFYAYYSDVYSVIDDIENDIVNNLLDLINEYDFVKFMSNPYPFFKHVTNFMNEDIEFYSQLFSTNVSGTIFEKIKIIIKDKLLLTFAENSAVDSTLVFYTVTYSIGGMITAYREWLNSNRKITLEELSKHLSLITANGMQSVIS